MLIIPTKQVVLVNNFWINRSNWIKTKLHQFFKNKNQVETKKIRWPNWHFWTKTRTKRV